MSNVPTTKNLLTTLAGLATLAAAAAAPQMSLPLARTAYQTNEVIDIQIVREPTGELPATDLKLSANGADGSRLEFVFAIPGGGTRRVEHLKLDARLLRPGAYTLAVDLDGGRAELPVDIHSHLRKSDFRLVNWGLNRANKDAAQWTMGENSLGFNTALGHYAGYSEHLIRAGVDWMRCCTMSGGHQMDLRMECDWSDPLVTRGGRRRMSREAFASRTRPNVLGVHAYDEPGLTWWKDPQTDKMTAHMVPPQVAAFKAAFGEEPLRYTDVDPANPEHTRQWRHWARWKLAFMDAAWQEAQFGVSHVKPEFMTLTQSQYGFSAFTDGYSFNVVRSLPITLGHGGYHDWGPGYFNPSMTLEIARARDWAKPCWYLPTWYGSTTAEQFRLQQYLSFQTGIQGLMTPPEIDPVNANSSHSAAAVVESNLLMGRLGTIFTQMPVTRPPVAMLYSLSNMIHLQATGMMDAYYGHNFAHGQNVYFTYLAGTLLQQPFLPVADEDIADGTLAAHHRALILTSIDHLDPEVVSALEQFIAAGGLVLRTADSKLALPGSVDLGVVPSFTAANRARLAEVDAELATAGLTDERQKELQAEKRALGAMRASLAGARELAAAIRPHLERAGIQPVLVSDQDGIVATRQAAGDLEYIFAVNATHDEAGDPQLGMKATTATIALPDDGRPVYDAVLGGPVAEFAKNGPNLVGRFRFGPGAMRVWARTARPIGSVRVGTPRAVVEFTDPERPLSLVFAASLLDDQGRLLAGAVPLRLRVVDSLGATRYDLHRATRDGVLQISLPLALNDPKGEWTVTVEELLAGSSDSATLVLPATPRGAMAGGRLRRAVHFADDAKNIYRFFRLHQEVTVAVGAGEANQAAAERLVAILKPWNIACTIKPAAELAVARALDEDEARTWVGLNYGRHQPGGGNPPEATGFAVRGPVVLLGTPADNPLIDFLAKNSFLPYAWQAGSFPGPGRGYLAWQYDGIGVGQESVTLIADDATGLAEAVGTLYEMVAGLDPLTPWELPRDNQIQPATASQQLPEGRILWQLALDDRVDALRAETLLTVVTHDGSVARIAATGTLEATQVEATASDLAKEILAALPPLDAATQATHAQPGRIVKQVATNDRHQAAGYWGGLVRVLDTTGQPIMARQFPADLTALAWLGDTLVVGLANGLVVALELPRL